MNKLILSAALMLLPLSATAKVLDSSDAGFTVENTVTVPVEPLVAWNALVKHVDKWWPKDHSWFGKDGKFSIEPSAGGCFCEIAGKRQAQHMTVSFSEPGTMLRMIGGLGPLQGLGLSGTMDWNFEKGEGGTKITLRYVAGGYTTTDLEDFAKIVDQVQGIQLGGLGTFLTPKKK